MILSFHPLLCADKYRLCAGRDLNDRDRYWMRRASAVLLPQHRHRELHLTALRLCANVFPDYTLRYRHPGKIGDIELFRKLALPHPRTWIFRRVGDVPHSFWEHVSYPLVIKSNYGGGGSLVYKARDHRHARECLREIGQMEARGFHGALVQEWVEGAGRTLRVAVIHRRFFSYWRVQENPHRFLHNRAAGARTDSSSDPGLQLRGVKLVRELIRKTGIELAGFDVLFSGPEAEPLLLEINYHFARDGLGGNDAYYRLLQSSVDEWLRRRGLRYSRKHPVRA